MVATRKRKSTRSPAKSKKTKAGDEEPDKPTDDQTTLVEAEAEAEEVEAPGKAEEDKEDAADGAAGDAKTRDAKNGETKTENAKAEDAKVEDAKVEDVKVEDDRAATEQKVHPTGGEATAEAAAPPKAAQTLAPKAAPAPAPKAVPAPAPKVAPAPAALPPGVPCGTPAPVVPAPVAPAPVAPAPVAPAPVAPAPVAPVPVAPAPEAVLEETGSVPALYVGRVIGRGGETVRDLQARSGCRIDVDQNVPRDAPRIITYRGTRAAIDLARRLVALLCTEGGDDANLPLGRASRRLVRVPETAVGKIIGRAGEMIRKMQSESQASIQVDHTGGGAEAGRRLVTITGTPESVAKAEEMVLFLAANPAVDALQALNMLTRDKTQGGGVWGSGPPYPNLPNQGQGMPDQGAAAEGYPGGGYGGPAPGYGGGGYSGGTYGPAGGDVGGTGPGSDVFPCSKTHVGRVIGQKGVTINDIQKRSGCDIQINQNVPQGQDCQITLRGSREGIEMAKRMLQDIIELGSNHPYAGGHGQFGVGQQGADQGYQQPAYGYGHPGQHPQMYAQQPYGMAPMQYGGQPGYSQPQTYPTQQYGVPHGAPQAPPSPWKAATAADGQVYYYNQITQETQWDRPAGMQ